MTQNRTKRLRARDRGSHGKEVGTDGDKDVKTFLIEVEFRRIANRRRKHQKQNNNNKKKVQFRVEEVLREVVSTPPGPVPRFTPLDSATDRFCLAVVGSKPQLRWVQVIRG